MCVYKNISATLVSLAGDIKQASGHSIETPIPSSVFNRPSGIQRSLALTTTPQCSKQHHQASLF